MGCFLEADIDYFCELYDLHNVHPVATKKNESNKRNAYIKEKKKHTPLPRLKNLFKRSLRPKQQLLLKMIFFHHKTK